MAEGKFYGFGESGEITVGDEVGIGEGANVGEIAEEGTESVLVGKISISEALITFRVFVV